MLDKFSKFVTQQREKSEIRAIFAEARKEMETASDPESGFVVDQEIAHSAQAKAAKGLRLQREYNQKHN